MTVRRVWTTMGATAAPLAVAVAAVPLRATVGSAAIAAVLVGVVALVGPMGSAATPALAGLSGALAYAVLWATPYGSLEIHRPGDRFVGLVVFVVGAGVGVWGRRRQCRPSEAEPRRRLRTAVRERRERSVAHLHTVGRVAGEIADGDTAGLVVLDVARSLVELLRLRDCEFELPPFAAQETPAKATLLRTGELELWGVRWDPTMVCLPDGGFYIPVVARGRVEGRYVCRPRRSWRPAEEPVMVALTLADQAASALLLDSVA
jgi:hypothetical protein